MRVARKVQERSGAPPVASRNGEPGEKTCTTTSVRQYEMSPWRRASMVAIGWRSAATNTRRWRENRLFRRRASPPIEETASFITGHPPKVPYGARVSSSQPARRD